MKRTLIIGASINPERYSYKAAQKLIENGHDIFMIGNKEGILFNNKIYTDKIMFHKIDTVTLYVSAKNQKVYYDYILSLKPQRVIFNPGTENEEFVQILKKNNIKVEIACSLVLLSINLY